MIITMRLGKDDEDLENWWLSLLPGGRSRALKRALRAYLEQEPLEEMLRRVARNEPHSQTTIPAQQSTGEIIGALLEAGAEAIQQTEFPKRGFVLRFHLKGHNYRIPVRYRYSTERGRRQALCWLLHYLKTLFEAELFAPLEQLLLAHVEIEGSKGTSTLGQWILPQLDHLDHSPLLPGVLEFEIEEAIEGEVLPFPPPDEEDEWSSSPERISGK